MSKKQKIIILVTIFLFIIYSIYTFLFQKKEQVDAILNEPLSKIVEEEQSEKVEQVYKVDIKGQVENPGVYEVKSNFRVMDVIQLAGGLKQNANTDFLNLSKKVMDGDVIWVYTEEEINKLKEGKTVVEYIEKECNCPDVSNSACATDKNSDKENNTKVNLNTASLEELMSLTGIGESKATLIIEYRNTKPFSTIEDIKNISGISDKVYEKIKDYITV